MNTYTNQSEYCLKVDTVELRFVSISDKLIYFIKRSVYKILIQYSNRTVTFTAEGSTVPLTCSSAQCHHEMLKREVADDGSCTSF